MSEEQLMARRALQEALDRRDNGGPPAEMLRRSETTDPSDQSPSDQSPAEPPESDGDFAAGVEPEPDTEPAVPAQPAMAEPRLGVPFPRVAA